MPRPTPSTLGQELLGDPTPVTDPAYAEPGAAVGSSVALGAVLRPVAAAAAADLSDMQIFVTNSTGKTIVLGQVRGSDKVSSIKARVQDSEGIPTDQQVLCSDAGRLLGDWQTLGDSGIGREAVLRLLLAGDTLPAAPTAHATALSARRGGILALCVVVGALLLFALFHHQPCPKCELPVENPRCDGSPCGARARYSCTCEDGWRGQHCDHDGPGVALEKVASHIKGVTAAGLKFIEDALPKGAGLQACVPAALRFIYLRPLFVGARICKEFI